MNLKKSEKWLSLFMLILFLASCNTKRYEKQEEVIERKEINESLYIMDSLYDIGDSRRYGIYPDSLNNKINPKTGKSLIASLLDFAEESQIIISFPNGYYGINLLIDSRENISLKFDKSAFNLIHITDANGKESSNIDLKGTLIAYDRFGVYKSNNITLDSLIVKTDTLKNLLRNKSRGCHIYRGTRDLKMKYLKVEDLASGSAKYKNNHAALAIDGLRDNPQNIKIDEVYIKSSDRHGAYITGSNHIFGVVKIDRYANGTVEFMTGMQDSDKGEERELSGLWINRCNNCVFNAVKILTRNSKNGVPLKLDEGKLSEPSFINKLALDVPYKDELVLDRDITNILVKKIELSND